jgi:tetratricopeptide (TPR) repeat protein
MQCKQYELGRKTYGYIIHNFEYTPSLNDNTIPRALDGLAKVYQNRGNPIDAKALCEASISYLAHTPETKDIDFAPAMKGLGKAWLELGNHPMAIEVYKSVLSICKETYGKDHPRTAGALKDLAKVYQTQERYEKAKAAYEYVYSIYEKNFGKDHSRTKKVQQNLRDLPQKAGKVDKSESIKKLMDKEVPDILLNFVKHHRRFPKLYGPELPQTDLVLWRHLFDKRPLVRTVTDRLKVREYVKGKIGEKYLPEILHETDDPSTIRFETLPDKFVIKSTQGSGRVIVVDGKSKMDKEMIIKECESWLDPANDYYKKTGSKVYKGNTQRIVIEGFIDNGSGSSPDDNKFFTYNGVARYLQVDKGRQGEHTIDLIDMQNGEKIPLKHDWIQSSSGDVPPPPHSKEMQELSQVLGKELGFGRIDWYPTEAQPIWGEITPAPGGGTWDFVPAMSNPIVSETWEAHSKTWRKLPGPSEEVYDLISQISRGLHKLVEEGQGHTHTKGLIMREKA